MNNSRISTLLGLHYDFLLGMFCSDRHVTPLGDLVLSDLVAEPYYNFFCPDVDFDLSSLAAISAKFHDRDRQPALYLTPLAGVRQGDLDTFTSLGCDSWIGRETAPRDSVDKTTDIEIERISGELREEYLSVFSAAYSTDDATALYGELEESYIHAMRSSFDITSSKYEKFFLLARIGGRAVGVVMLMVAGPYAGAYGLGTVADARDRGVGVALMGECLHIAFETGATFIFGQAEAGSRPEKFYQKLGWNHLFYGTYYEPTAPR